MSGNSALFPKAHITRLAGRSKRPWIASASPRFFGRGTPKAPGQLAFGPARWGEDRPAPSYLRIGRRCTDMTIEEETAKFPAGSLASARYGGRMRSPK